MLGKLNDETNFKQFKTNNKCEFCGSNTRMKTCIKCNHCECTLHLKCFEKIAKVVKLKKLSWQCKNCCIDSSIDELLKENTILKIENEILKKVIKDQESMYNLQKVFLEQNVNYQSKLSTYSDEAKINIKQKKKDSVLLKIESGTERKYVDKIVKNAINTPAFINIPTWNAENSTLQTLNNELLNKFKNKYNIKERSKLHIKQTKGNLLIIIEY